MPLTKAAESGDRLATLRELRALLAKKIERCNSARDLAALTNRMQSVLAEIDELTPKTGEGDGIDEIAERRAARRSSAAKSSTRAKRSS